MIYKYNLSFELRETMELAMNTDWMDFVKFGNQFQQVQAIQYLISPLAMKLLQYEVVETA